MALATLITISVHHSDGARAVIMGKEQQWPKNHQILVD